MRASRLRRRGVATIVLVALLHGREAVAQEPSPATKEAAGAEDELIAAGVGLRKLGRDTEALKAFEQAYALRPTPRAAAQMALAHQARGEWAEAERGLLEALSAPDDAWVIRNGAHLHASLATVRGRLGWLTIESNAPGEVWLDGRMLARLPLAAPLRVATGDLSIEIRTPARGSLRRTIRVEPGSHAYAALTFVPPADTAIGSSGPSGTAWAHPSARRRALGLWLLGSAGATLAVALTAQGTREWEAKEYDDDPTCGPTATLTRYQRCGANRDIGTTAQTIAIVGYAMSGVSAITGAWLMLTAPTIQSTTAGQVRCTVGAATVGCGVAF